MKGNEDVCERAFAQIRHWPPGGVEVEQGERTTKSALRKSKDINAKRNSVSWSSKVTCKTYSKDDPNAYNFFNANESTSEGMNFSGHADPLYDPHAQNEARVLDHPPNDMADFDPYGPSDGSGFQNNVHAQQPQQNQPPPNQHFDQYYNTGLDYANQQPDAMYGDSQAQNAPQGDGASWEGSEGTGSYEQGGSFGRSDSRSSAASSGSGSYSDSTDASSGAGSFSQQQDQNDEADTEFEEDGSGTYEEGSAGSSRGSSNTSASNYSDHNAGGQEGEFYDAQSENDEEDYENDGSYSSGSGGDLPPVT